MSQLDARDIVKEMQNLLSKIGMIVGGKVVQIYRYDRDTQNYNLLNIDQPNLFAASAGESRAPFALGYVEPGLKDPVYIQSFNIVQFPGCCALCISTGTTTSAAFRNKGINRLAIQLRILIASYIGYTAMLCTDVAHSVYSIKSIEKAGYKKFDDLINRRTKNRVNLYITRLP